MPFTKKPEIIEGNIFKDERGVLSFVNDFDMTPIKRVYTIQHPDTSIVRAWQGHKIEQKWFLVTEGSFCVAWVEIDNWEAPSETLEAFSTILSSGKSEVLHIPAGYANGIKALEANSRITIFSDLTMDEAKGDNIRFDKNLWMDWGNRNGNVK